MIEGCMECESAIILANMTLKMTGEAWMIHNHDGHSHLSILGGGGTAYAVRLHIGKE